MMFKSSLQRDLDRFFKSLYDEDYNIRSVTKSALSQARAKLNPWAFKRLNEVAVKSFYESAPYLTWNGFRLTAIDGSRIVLPNHPSVREEFGTHAFGPKADSERFLAMISMFYDVLNSITIDAQIAPYSSSEQYLLLEHSSCFSTGDLLLLDRGYPNYWLLFYLKAKGIDFCVRLKDDWWLKVRDFAKSNEKECILRFSLPKKDRKKLTDYPDMWNEEIACRLIKVELDNGETEILCTSLLDTQTYPAPVFKELYHLRWNEEEAYKLLKCRIELEDFSGKTATAVKQDFYAKIFMMTLCAAFSLPIAEKVKAGYKADENRKYAQQINKTSALANTSEILISVFLKNQFHKAITAFDRIVECTREIVRPNRNIPRNKKPKRIYSMNYKKL